MNTVLMSVLLVAAATKAGTPVIDRVPWIRWLPGSSELTSTSIGSVSCE